MEPKESKDSVISMVDLLAIPNSEDIDFMPPRMGDGWFNPWEYTEERAV